MKLHVKKGDLVYVNAGKDSGSKGRVLQVFPDKQKAIVEGVNMVKRHTKPNNTHPNGGIIEKEAPIHISNLMIVDPETGKPTRIGRRYDENNKLVRFSKKSGKEIK